ncbi:MAG TPA: DUF962 domain-containing protein [Steroidobacteraceae bacterium]|nr:DUF962 domain-containing protein [Steroidobacteraceae bacterium]
MPLRKLAPAVSLSTSSSMPHDRFTSFSDFYPFYLSEHRSVACRRLHFAGTMTVIVLALAAVLSMRWWLFALVPIAGYGFAWAGHFIFEHNKPATFAHPWYSLFADFVMFRDMLTGRIKF